MMMHTRSGIIRVGKTQIEKHSKRGVVGHVYNPSTQEVEAKGS